MHITINTFGTRGDVQPYVALGVGLQSAGHHVRILTNAPFESFVREHGLDFRPIAVDPRQVLMQENLEALGRNPVAMVRFMKAKLREVMPDLFRATDEAADGADLLLNSTMSWAGFHVAEKRGLPACAAYLQPYTPTRAFHGMTATPAPSWLPFKGLYNYATIKFYNQAFFRMLHPIINECRRDILGLPPLGAGFYWKLDTAPAPMLYAYSPSLLPKPADWGPQLHVTGFWFLEQTETYEPPAELVEFLADGPPPVYIGFGSMVDHARVEMGRLIVEALDMAGSRAILLGGWGDLAVAGEHHHILHIDYAPHEWLFPRVAAVVHHGGVGTLAAGMRAGVPTVVVPFYGDQFFWGWCVEQKGIGPAAIPRRELTAERLAGAIRAATTDEAMRRRAAALGEVVSAEDGVARAIAAIVAEAGAVHGG